MKKHAYLTVLACFLITGIFAQSQRLVLLEQFTQASCGPCATWNPTIQALLDANPDKITAINYHVSWPGYDPMNNHNPQDPGARVGYYSVSGVPHSVLDGNFFSGFPSGWNINTVNTRYAVPSPFELEINQYIPASEDYVDVTLLIKAVDNISGDIHAYIAVIEKNITFSSPPGSNGEKNFHNVLKKLLPKKTGKQLPTSFETGDYVILQSTWEFANVYDVNEIAAVSFVQNDGTKEVHQAANSSEDQISAPYNNDVEVTLINNVPEVNCSGAVQPHVVIRNNGSNDLTSLQIHYKINGGAVSTLDWAGNLGFLETEEVALDEGSFFILDDNVLQVYSTEPNGATDDYPKNDTLIQEFKKAHILENQLRVVIITDDNPGETTWEVTNSSGAVMFSGGPFTQPNTIIEEYFDVTVEDCYQFTIFDSGNYGLCCEHGQGAWGIYDNNTEIGKGGIFTSRDSTYFNFGPYTGSIETISELTSVSVYPNPFTNETNLGLILDSKENVTIEIINALGKKVREMNLGLVEMGGHTFTIQRNNLESGLYFLNIRIGDNNLSKKLFIH
ncbi:MAG: T9SS type A sorting domain-containing protein [Bacteroidales bacterium]|nr:T9SS type A sorting domain-containing protein [Bacteroidales bacterium]